MMSRLTRSIHDIAEAFLNIGYSYSFCIALNPRGSTSSKGLGTKKNGMESMNCSPFMGFRLCLQLAISSIQWDHGMQTITCTLIVISMSLLFLLCNVYSSLHA
ncbi:hypothetical protein KP509_07G002200 [Ceratopteris richardii]|uniref:Uncharacterized protein n=1 Tax=Ceratopteris richardii TaxID=49495 RepID=A0A8T2UEP5_CERRI|nr:hypothetical protein KP509_07G002200 [Ceratopteris richardii]